MQAAAVRRASRARAREVSDVQPAALMPQWAARLLGFAALALVAALEWRRLIAHMGSSRAVAWMIVATAGGGAVVAASRLRGRRRALALAGAAAGALLAGYLVSGADPALLKPHHWDDLITGVAGGTQSLGTVRLPYDAQDPWPGIALQLIGAGLLVLAGLLAVWPRARGRGYPFLSLIALMVLIASPVVSLGGTRSLALGAVLAALTVCFLWLERLPLRPGIGVAALLGLALAGALPLASLANRGEPWFDYRAFAEGLGPNDPVQFSWRQGYGPITWPRDGNEILRVQADQPTYWKARDLDVFDGRAWRVRPDRQPPVRSGDAPWQADAPPDWRSHPAWTTTIKVSIRRMRSPSFFGAGTTVSITDNSRSVKAGLASGTWDSVGALRRGDSYVARVYEPKPTAAQLQGAAAGDDQRVDDDLVVSVPLKRPTVAGLGPGVPAVSTAEVQFRPWGDSRLPFASYSSVGRSVIGRSDFHVKRVMRGSRYARTWALAQRLRRGAKSPYDFVQRVNRFLAGPQFRYTERPPAPARGRLPLDAFLIDSHAGYCQHFAGAMALLLRMGGVPARVATGFTPGGFSKLHNAWVVRDVDAHAWVEVWFDRYGWVTFDPTPAATPARSQIAAITAAAPAPGTAPILDTGNPGGVPQNAKNKALPADQRLAGFANSAPTPAAVADAGPPAWTWALLAAAVLALAAAFVVLLRRRGSGPGMDRAILELEAALRRCGRPLRPGTTLRQLEHRLGDSPEIVAYLRALSAGRYAARPAPPPRSGRRALRRALGSGLGVTGRLRALWALPPRLR